MGKGKCAKNECGTFFENQDRWVFTVHTHTHLLISGAQCIHVL